jgi:hypothetical protein
MSGETKTNNEITFKTTERNSKNYEHKIHVWNLSGQTELGRYLSQPSSLKVELGGTIVAYEDEDEKEFGKTIGYKIKTEDKFKDITHLVYLLVININGKEIILKGGKVKGKLGSRSYPAGTEYNWTMKSSCSPTNYIYSQIFRMAVKENIPIKFYVYPVPTISVPITSSTTGKEIMVVISPYEEVEKDLNKHLKKLLGKKPIGEGGLLEKSKF